SAVLAGHGQQPGFVAKGRQLLLVETRSSEGVEHHRLRMDLALAQLPAKLDGFIRRHLLRQRHEDRCGDRLVLEKRPIRCASFSIAPGGTVSASTRGTLRKEIAWPVAGASITMMSNWSEPLGSFCWRW